MVAELASADQISDEQGRGLRGMVGVCCSEPGQLRDWLVDVIPVGMVMELEEPLRLLSGGATGTSPQLPAQAAVALARLADLLDQAAAAIEPADWWRPMHAEVPDALTSLRTRRTWSSDLMRAFAAAREDAPLTLVLIDLDFFKSINDRYGHQMGDEVLAAVGARLRKIVGHKGAAYRWGGEELAVLLPNTDAAEGQALAWRVLRAIRALRFPTERPGPAGRVDLTLTASLGWSSVPSVGVRSAEDLVGQADLRMYEVKSTGRNSVWEAPRGGVERPLRSLAARPLGGEVAHGAPTLLDPYEARRVALEELFARVTRATRTTFAPTRLFSPIRYPGINRENYHQKAGRAAELAGNDVVDFENARTGVCTGELVAVREILDEFVVLEVPMGGRRVRIHFQFIEPPWEHTTREIGMTLLGTIVVPEDRSAFLWLEPAQRTP